MFILMTGTMTFLHWKTPDARELLLLCATGIVAGVAQFALFEGMRQAPVSVLAPFEYTSLVWAFVLGYLIWSDIPKQNVFIGAILILSAGGIIIISERRRRRVPA
jgi:drug/metabolite transporter (DMT)-like permease